MKRSYVFSAIEMTTCIITKASSTELITFLELDLYKKGIWENSAQYILSYLPSFSPFDKEVNDRFVVISPPIDGWIILSSRKFGFLESAIEIARTMSRKFGETFVYYSDMHCAYKSLSICCKGKVNNIIEYKDSEIEIRGNLSHLKRQINPNDDNIGRLMDEYIFNMNTLIDKESYYYLESCVCILTQKSKRFNNSLMPKHIVQETLNSFPICQYFNISQQAFIDSPIISGTDFLNSNIINDLPF
ncbi:MAG: hypothetical protein AB8B69_07025 [Chitinophagales bacterium]